MYIAMPDLFISKCMHLLLLFLLLVIHRVMLPLLDKLHILLEPICV